MILAVISIHSLFPRARRYTQLLYQLPYSNGDGWYLQGADDALFVLGCLISITAIRATVIEGIYQLSTQCRLVTRKACMRFAEQGFLLLYHTSSFSVGMVGNPKAFLHQER